MAQPITEARAGVSRRSFLKGDIAGGLALAAAGAAGAAGATLAQTQSASAAIPTNASDYAGAYEFPTSIDEDPYFDAPEAIEDSVEEYDVDVIVIGAGAAGVPAACAASEETATEEETTLLAAPAEIDEMYVEYYCGACHFKDIENAAISSFNC